MTARALLVQLLARGVELKPHGDRIAFRPAGLDEATLRLIREHKAALLALLLDEAAVRAARAKARAIVALEDASLMAAIRRWEATRPKRRMAPGACPACRRDDHWQSRYGARFCRTCHPPAPGVEVPHA